MNRCWFGIRALACEQIFGLAMWICPDKYCPSYIETLIDAQTKLVDRGWRVSKASEEDAA
jgi:hypothetical protein